MSYRSDIRIRLTKEDFERLKEEFEKTIATKFGFNLFDDMNVYKEEKNQFVYTQNEDNEWEEKKVDSVYFGWNSLKWYDGYEEVDFINDFVFKCSYYAFIRIGESSEGDVESLADGFDNIGYYYAFDDDEGGNT